MRAYRKKGKGSPARFPEALGLPSSKGRRAAGLAEASTLMGAPALDAGLPCSPAGTNPPGREKRGARQQDARLTNKGGLLLRVCLCQTDRPTPARRLAHQAAEPVPSRLPERLRRVRAVPRIREGRGANPGLSRADLFPFAATDFGVSRAPSERRAPVFILLFADAVVRSQELVQMQAAASFVRSHSDVARKQDFTKGWESATTEPDCLTPCT